MTTEELLEAFKSDRRTPVDVNFGQIPLSPAIGRAGNYQVVQRGVVQDNPAAELSRALAQLPQIAGQFANIQQTAGVKDVQELDNEEIIRRVESGDTEATGFLKDWGKQRGYSRALYDQYYKTKTLPKLEAFESKLASMTPEELSMVLTDGGNISAMNDDQIQAALEQQFRDITTPKDGIELDDHMKVLHNESLRRIPLFAAKALGVIRKKQNDYINAQTAQGLSDSIASYSSPSYNPPSEVIEEGEITQPQVFGNVTVYSPQKHMDKMEGDYASSKKGPDGKRLVRTVMDVVNGSSDYITLAGSPQFYGRSYIIPSLPYTDPETGEVAYLENVRGVVHDTGSAFKTAPEGRFDIPLGRDLKNKAMNDYNGLLNRSGIQFIREVNQDGDPQDYKDPNERPVAPLSPEEQRQQNVEAYNISLTNRATGLANHFTNAVDVAKRQGSTLTDEAIEKQAVETLQTQLITMVTQGGDNMNIVDEFLEKIENGDVLLEEGNPLFNTSIGKSLFTNVTRAYNAAERRLDEEGGDEVDLEEENTRALLTENNAIKTTDLSRSEKEEALKKAEALLEKNDKERAEGNIIRSQHQEVEAAINSTIEEIKGGGGKTSYDLEFLPNVIKTYNRVGSFEDLGSIDSVFALLSQHEEEPMKAFQSLINDDETGTVERIVFGELKRVQKRAVEEANDQITKWLTDLYKEADVLPTGKLPDLSADELLDKYTEFLSQTAKNRYDAEKTQVARRISQQLPKDQKQQTQEDIPLGMTPEQVEAERTREQAGTTVLDSSGKLREERLFESKTKYLKKALETATDEEAVETLKANNTPKRVAQFYQGTQDKYFKTLKVDKINDNEERRKKAEEAYKFTKQFGMPMAVIRDGFNASMTPQSARNQPMYGYFDMSGVGFNNGVNLSGLSASRPDLHLNSNNRFETLDYATNGVYNLNASLQAANGDTGALREIYGRVFSTEEKKKVVSFEKFVELQIELGRKQGRIKPAQ